MIAREQRRGAKSPAIDLQYASDEALLALRLCELPVQLGNSLMSRRVARLQRELAARSIVARPHVWLSEEFFTPERVLGFAVPFYLAHPRLMCRNLDWTNRTMSDLVAISLLVIFTRLNVLRSSPAPSAHR